MQAARAQLDVLERFPVGAKRAVVVDATRHVRPVSLYDSAASGLLEIENVKGLGRIRNDTGSSRGVLGQHISLEVRGDSAERSDVRTSCKKLEKFPAGGIGCSRVLHDCCRLYPQSNFLASRGNEVVGSGRWR